jgi:hypothetical protein
MTHSLFSRFGVAEQAINAIYLLGEQPDRVCDEITKNLTSRVFNAPPEPVPAESASDVESPPSQTPALSEAGDTTMDVDDAATATAATPRAKEKTATTTDMGDAFKLSQLVFVVGHVAIKHIVYLELIERELKRRKEVSTKGTLTVRDLYILSLIELYPFQRKEPIAEQAHSQQRMGPKNSIKLQAMPRTRLATSSRVSRKTR